MTITKNITPPTTTTGAMIAVEAISLELTLATVVADEAFPEVGSVAREGMGIHRHEEYRQKYHPTYNNYWGIHLSRSKT